MSGISGNRGGAGPDRGAGGVGAVSSTHLDVYKRQPWNDPCSLWLYRVASNEALHTGNKQWNGIGALYKIFIFSRYEI